MEDKIITKSLTKKAWERTRRNYQTLSLSLSFFALVCLGCLVAAFFLPAILIVAVPFIMIPAFFSLSASNIILEKTPGKEGFAFFFMFKAYFANIFRGGYRLFVGFLFGLAAFVVTSIVSSTILNATILTNNQAYIEFSQTIANVRDIDTFYNVLNEYINNDRTFQDVIIISSIISIFFATWTFLHHISINGLKLYNNLLSRTPLPISDLNLVHKMTMKKIGRALYKDYYKSLWFFLILIPLGMAAGVAIGKFVLPNTDSSKCIVLGILGMFLFTLFFLPYYFNVMQLIYEKYGKDYVSSFVTLSFESIEQIKKTMSIDPEKEKEIIDFLNKQKSQIENKDENKNDKEN